MKILILYIFSPSNIYNKMIKIQQTYIHTYKNIDSYFVTFDENQSENVKIIGDIIYVKGTESYTNILYKTMMALDYLINKLKRKYDFIVRSNISTVINMHNLISYLETCPTKMLYTGGKLFTLRWKLTSQEIANDKQHLRNSFYGLKFIQGTSIILSYDVVKILLNHPITYDIVDDVKLSLLIREHLFGVYDNLTKVALAKRKSNGFNEETVFIRNKRKDRKLDVCAMYREIFMLKEHYDLE